MFKLLLCCSDRGGKEHYIAEKHIKTLIHSERMPIYLTQMPLHMSYLMDIKKLTRMHYSVMLLVILNLLFKTLATQINNTLFQIAYNIRSLAQLKPLSDFTAALIPISMLLLLG